MTTDLATIDQKPCETCGTPFTPGPANEQPAEGWFGPSRSWYADHCAVCVGRAFGRGRHKRDPEFALRRRDGQKQARQFIAGVMRSITASVTNTYMGWVDDAQTVLRDYEYASPAIPPASKAQWIGEQLALALVSVGVIESIDVRAMAEAEVRVSVEKRAAELVTEAAKKKAKLLAEAEAVEARARQSAADAKAYMEQYDSTPRLAAGDAGGVLMLESPTPTKKCRKGLHVLTGAGPCIECKRARGRRANATYRGKAA
jgi:hypothetical protein